MEARSAGNMEKFEKFWVKSRYKPDKRRTPPHPLLIPRAPNPHPDREVPWQMSQTHTQILPGQ
jgi:hypothetical protein